MTLIRACAVMVQPITFADRGFGYLVVRRVGPPIPDGLAFPGGWMEPGETPEQAAQREFREEVGLEVPLPIYLWSMMASAGFPLLFCKSRLTLTWAEARREAKLQESEVSEIEAVIDPFAAPLCFDTHQTTMLRLLGFKEG